MARIDAEPPGWHSVVLCGRTSHRVEIVEDRQQALG
jgi:hypothetical protein